MSKPEEEKLTQDQAGEFGKKIVLTMVFRFMGTALWCLTVMNLWKWFVMPMHPSLPMLSVYGAFGAWLLVAMFRRWRILEGELPRTVEQAQKVLLRAILTDFYMLGALGLGWLLQWISHG